MTALRAFFRLPPKRRAIVVALVALLLAMHAWLALRATIDLGVTADETIHLTSGYSYWRYNDYRLQPENGNLPQRWAALPLLAQTPAPRLEPADAPELWTSSQQWLIAQRFLFASGNNTDYLLLCARAAMVGWSVATGLLVFFWSRKLWGDAAGVFSVGLFSISPTMLAHGPLITSDMCAAFWMLAATAAWWQLCQRLTLPRLIASTLALGLAAVAKFSVVLLGPVFVAIALWQSLRPAPLVSPIGGALTTRATKLAAFTALGGVHVLTTALIIWAFFGFRFPASAPLMPPAASFYLDWSSVLPKHGLLRAVLEFAHAHQLLPEAYLHGFAHVMAGAQERGAFLAGEFSTKGWWWFFPYALLVKSSLAELFAASGLFLMAGFAFARSGLRGVASKLQPLLPFALLAVVVLGAAMASSLNIGHRHVLVLYPVLFVFSGGLLRHVTRASAMWCAALLALGTSALVRVTPDHLAFFNSLAGGPREGWRHLVDSSLDWGQNVPKLARWLNENAPPGGRVYLSLFGSDDPFYHGIRGIELAPYFSFGRERHWVELEPGLYCVSATMLQDVYSPYAGPWSVKHEASYQKLIPAMREEIAEGRRSTRLGEFGLGPEHLLWNADRARFARFTLYLRHRTPDARVGNSIFIYRLTAEELRVVADGNFTELADAILRLDQSGNGQGN
ncbi:MAG: hypothetical protein NVV63_02215 [Opitutus sp.]|nr:hypothetical protein [Opitutus sp.]